MKMFQDSHVKIHVFRSARELGQAAAAITARLIRTAIKDRGRAFLVIATGKSQEDFLAALGERGDIDWAKTVLFQLDEYVGLPSRHPATLGEFIRQNLIDRVHPGEAHLIEEAGAENIGLLVSRQTIDVAFVGIGENSHLAFNDPPADFETEEPYIVVELDHKCRQQQVGEGWFRTIADVPKTAVSMSIRQILKSREILCVVPERRKAEAVRDCLHGEITPIHPASILQRHPRVTFFLDEESASLLDRAHVTPSTGPVEG
jgi:glucosamine-6-phosphate deaminase